MKKVILALAVAATLAFLSPVRAQEQNTSVAMAAHAAAWGQISAITISDFDLPPVAGLAVIVEGGVNSGPGRRIQLLINCELRNSPSPLLHRYTEEPQYFCGAWFFEQDSNKHKTFQYLYAITNERSACR